MAEPRNLLIVGASARAAAQSAQRAGFAVTAIDLFADEDLAECATTLCSADFPRDLVRLAREAPPGPWMYTGGLENHPRVVDAISASRPLWGNGGDVLRRVRDPLAACDVLVKANLPALDVTLDPTDVPGDGSWLAKPIRGSGGRDIHRLDAQSPRYDSYLPRGKQGRVRWYFQRRQDGVAASAQFVGFAGQGMLFGVTEQLVGEPWCGGRPFQYAGSLFPLRHDQLVADERFHAELQSLGDALASAFDLVGLFGVDGVIHDRKFWPVEINPRYTASCEVIEQASGLSLVRLHAAACDEDEPFDPQLVKRWSGCCGKLIVYADRACQFTAKTAAWVSRHNADETSSRVADIPRVGTAFSPGDPLVTVLARCDRMSELRGRLVELAAEVRGRLDLLGV